MPDKDMIWGVKLWTSKPDLLELDPKETHKWKVNSGPPGTEAFLCPLPVQPFQHPKMPLWFHLVSFAVDFHVIPELWKSPSFPDTFEFSNK